MASLFSESIAPELAAVLFWIVQVWMVAVLSVSLIPPPMLELSLLDKVLPVIVRVALL